MNTPSRTFLSSLATRGICWSVVALVAACSSKATTRGGDESDSTQPKNTTLTEEQLKKIQIVTVQPVSFRPAVQATGNVAFNGDHSTQVLSPVSGPATRVVAEPGMNVTKGQPLAYVSSPDFASAVADYRKAQTAYRNAKRIADRDSALFKNDALARSDLEQAQADVSSADADLDASVQNMRALGVEESQIDAVRQGKTTAIEAIIRSPIDGTVVEKLIADGQLLQAGTTPVATVADLSTMWIMANVFADDLRDVGEGQPVDIITDASRTPIPGKVDYIAALADPGTKAVTVRVLAPNNNRVLRRDMFVRVEIKARDEHRGILVPLAAVLRDDQNLPYVYVEATGGFARRRIDLGTRVGDQY
ncbi:MAG: efflux RND transporter periplasmic adaptor subunit, partial [Gemmatimonadaceae bacterium]